MPADLGGRRHEALLKAVSEVDGAAAETMLVDELKIGVREAPHSSSVQPSMDMFDA